MEELISVIVPVYNVKEYLDACIESIMIQSYQNLEIILVDDGSTDGSGDVCDQYAILDSRIIVLHKKNEGLSAARNDALDMCHGEYVTFVDSDDMLCENSLQDMYHAMQSSGAEIVQGLHTKEFENADASAGRIQLYDGKTFLEKDILDTMACGKLYRRDIWENKRFKRGILHEDFQIMYQLVYETEKVALLESNVYYVRERTGSITRSGYSDKHLVLLDIDVERIEYFRTRNEYDLLEHAYCDYYNHLLHLYCLCRKPEIRTLYWQNFKYFMRIKRINWRVKCKLFLCLFCPLLWEE